MRIQPLLIAITSVFFAVSSFAFTRYVNVNNTSPASPYTSWATAATNIQDAIDRAGPIDEVLVTNGVYRSGGKAIFGTMTNRVAVDKAITVRSVNGPAVTVIEGRKALDTTVIRCAYLADGAKLAGFTLTNGATFGDFDPLETSAGGAVWCESNSGTISNCVITGNTSFAAAVWYGTVVNCLILSNSAYTATCAYQSVLSNCTLLGNTAIMYGGGAQESVLTHCLLIGNTALFSGGGAAGGVLNDCVLTGNYASFGGGTYYSSATNCTVTGNAADSFGAGGYGGNFNNCILYFNSTTNGDDFQNSSASALDYCCTTPMPTNGIGNFTNAPLFVDMAAGDFRLQPNSPCINSGLNFFVANSMYPSNVNGDLDGNPRIAGGTVDVGAYEFQSPGSTISYAWLQDHGLATDGSVDNIDSDHDGQTTWQEWQADTDPADTNSVTRMLVPTNSADGIVVQWTSADSRHYTLERSTNLTTNPAFSAVIEMLGTVGATSYVDTNSVADGPVFYRVSVRRWF